MSGDDPRHLRHILEDLLVELEQSNGNAYYEMVVAVLWLWVQRSRAADERNQMLQAEGAALRGVIAALEQEIGELEQYVPQLETPVNADDVVTDQSSGDNTADLEGNDEIVGEGGKVADAVEGAEGVAEGTVDGRAGEREG
jgi:hypothetical protein